MNLEQVCPLCFLVFFFLLLFLIFSSLLIASTIHLIGSEESPLYSKFLGLLFFSPRLCVADKIFIAMIVLLQNRSCCWLR